MKINFITSGAAFQDEYADEETNKLYIRTEVVRILKKITAEIEQGEMDGPIMDINGNKVGKWEI